MCTQHRITTAFIILLHLRKCSWFLLFIGKISSASEVCCRSSLMQTMSVRTSKYFNCVQYIEGTILSGFQFSCVCRISVIVSESPCQMLYHLFFFFFAKKASVNVTFQRQLFGSKLYPLAFAYQILQSCARTWLLENISGYKSD